VRRKRCAECGDPFESRYWYPVAFDERSATVVEFCSVDCKRRYLVDG